MSEIRGVFSNFIKYKDLLRLLVIKEIKIKYKRSFIGVFWSLLSPLLTMIILTLVFKELFKFNVKSFAAYVITGQIIFNFFSESTSLAMTSIYTGGQLIKKVYVPKYVFPVSKVLYSLVNTLFALIAAIIVCLITGVAIKWTVIYSLTSIIYVLIFSIGLGLVLSSLVTFFRDIEHIYGVLLMAWMYATPIIYPMDIMPQKYLFLMYSNPMYYFVTHFRTGIFYGQVPPWELTYQCISYAFITFLGGLYFFYKKQDEFIMYI